jgi:surface carbohydrate biosynthesis protein
MRRRVLYLPIETKARELYGKVLLASKAAERGWQVVFGTQEVIREALRHGPPGVHIEISIPESKKKKLATYRSYGHKLASICEESIVYYDALDYCRRKVGASSIDLMDVMLIAGESNARDLRKHRPNSDGKIVVTGNPRFDTLTPAGRAIFQETAKPFAERFGRFLLVNTNFMRTNHFKLEPDELINRLQSQKAIVDDEHAEMVRRQYVYKGEQMEKLKPVLADIAESKRFDHIVIRPHPSENHDTWREWAKPYGIDVIYEGSANSWILAADSVLHTGCTTGIEGVLLDRPVASFAPIPGHDLLNQADSVSEQVIDADAFLGLVDRWENQRNENQRNENQRTMLEPQRRKLSSLITNVDPPLAVNRIIDTIDKLDVPEAEIGALDKPRGNPFLAFFRRAKAQSTGRLGAYHRQKFPGLRDDEILEPTDLWVRTGILSRRPELRHSPMGAWVLS